MSEMELCREIQEASWARGIAMLDSDVAAFRDALLPVVRRWAEQRAAEELRAAADVRWADRVRWAEVRADLRARADALDPLSAP